MMAAGLRLARFCFLRGRTTGGGFRCAGRLSDARSEGLFMAEFSK